jgi:hypothetical protein
VSDFPLSARLAGPITVLPLQSFYIWHLDEDPIPEVLLQYEHPCAVKAYIGTIHKRHNQLLATEHIIDSFVA